MESLRVREAIHLTLFILMQDIQWYLKRKGKNLQNVNSIIKYAMEILVKLLAPFAPHLCEEIWEKYGNKNFISIESWPIPRESFINPIAETIEEYIKNIIEDSLEIIKVTEITPSKIYYYIASKWKWDVYLKAIQLLEEGIDTKMLIREIMKDQSIRSKGSIAIKFLNSISQLIITMDKDYRKRILSIGPLNELDILNNNKSFLEEYFKCKVYIMLADEAYYDPKSKADQSIPLRPAIYIE